MNMLNPLGTFYDEDGDEIIYVTDTSKYCSKEKIEAAEKELVDALVQADKVGIDIKRVLSELKL